MATPERLVIENLLMIPDKEGNDVEFRLNPAQAKLDAQLTGRDVIPKARQQGISTYFLARNLVRCIGHRNRRAVIITHEREASERLLYRVHYMVKNFRGPKPIMNRESINLISFEKTGSLFYIGTAGSKTFGRGDTITDLHCSEVAFWSDPQKILSGLFQAVPKSGNVSIESTGNGVGNYYHKTCMRAAQGQSQYRMHFFPWHTFPEYELQLTPELEQAILNNLLPELEEIEIMEKFDLTAGQLAWRRMKLEELDYNFSEFKQEYPMTLEECFQSTGRSIFHIVRYKDKEPNWIQQDKNYAYLEGYPKPDHKYGLGADVSAGVGQDNSVIQVVDLNESRQVAEYASNRITPDMFAFKIRDVARIFSNAFVNIENNNHGILTISEILKIYPRNLIYARPKAGAGLRQEIDKITDFGFRTSVKSKPFAIGELRKWLAESDGLEIYSELLKSELDTFIETETGTLEAEEGCYDDRVMALAMIAAIRSKAMLHARSSNEIKLVPRKEEIDPLSGTGIIESMLKRATAGGGRFKNYVRQR